MPRYKQKKKQPTITDQPKITNELSDRLKTFLHERHQQNPDPDDKEAQQSIFIYCILMVTSTFLAHRISTANKSSADKSTNISNSGDLNDPSVQTQILLSLSFIFIIKTIILCYCYEESPVTEPSAAELYASNQFSIPEIYLLKKKAKDLEKIVGFDQLKTELKLSLLYPEYSIKELLGKGVTEKELRRGLHKQLESYKNSLKKVNKQSPKNPQESENLQTLKTNIVSRIEQSPTKLNLLTQTKFHYPTPRQPKFSSPEKRNSKPIYKKPTIKLSDDKKKSAHQIKEQEISYVTVTHNQGKTLNVDAKTAEALKIVNDCCNEKGFEIFLKGHNATQPEENPMDIDLVISCSTGTNINEVACNILLQCGLNSINIGKTNRPSSKKLDRDFTNIMIVTALPIDITITTKNKTALLKPPIIIYGISGLRQFSLNRNNIFYKELFFPCLPIPASQAIQTKGKVENFLKKGTIEIQSHQYLNKAIETISHQLTNPRDYLHKHFKKQCGQITLILKYALKVSLQHFGPQLQGILLRFYAAWYNILLDVLEKNERRDFLIPYTYKQCSNYLHKTVALRDDIENIKNKSRREKAGMLSLLNDLNSYREWHQSCCPTIYQARHDHSATNDIQHKEISAPTH